MLKVGITGGIGSGKTTVANLFKELGVKIFEADDISRELTEIHQPAYQAIVKRYGGDILDEHQDINRKKMRAIIFKDEREREWLENLLHPLIKEKICEETLYTETAYCLIVIPLLVETQSFHLIDRVLVVDTPIELQIQRTIIRDSINEQMVLTIMANQATREQRLARADDIIINDGNISELKKQIGELHNYYTALAAH